MRADSSGPRTSGRSIPHAIERLVTRIEDEAEASGGEIDAERVGELSLDGLRELDRIAYLQFAAVYKGFSDPDEFSAELRRFGVEPPPKLGDRRSPVPSGEKSRVDNPL